MSTLSLEHVLRLALPPGSSAVVGAGLSRPVNGVVLVRPTRPALPQLWGGELVLVASSSLAALDEGLDLALFVERLSATPIAAIAVLGAVDAPAQTVGARLAMPLISLPAQSDLREVQREVQRLISDPEAQMERRAAQLFSALTREAMEGRGVAGIIDTLSRWTGREVRYLAGQASQRAQVPVVVGGRQVGGLQLVGREPWDRLAAEQGAAALALLLDKERAVQAAEERFRGELVELLISGLPFDLETTLPRAAALGYDLQRPHVVLLLAPEGDLLLDRLEAGLRREFERAGRKGPIGRRGGAVLGLYPPEDPAHSAEELRPVQQRLQTAGLTCSGGMSDAGPLESWPASVGEAEQALQLGRQLFGPGQLVAAADLGLYRLLLLLRDRSELQSFYERTIGPLVAYEGRPDGELLQTLQAYCARLGNHARTATALHIHRNTLLYRLGRISRITGLDVDQEEDRLALQIGLRVHRLMQSKQGGR